MWPFKKRAEQSKPKPQKKDIRIRSFGGFEAANSNLLTSWTTEPASPDSVIQGSLKRLRARSREQYRNNDYAQKYISMIKSNVIGPVGIQLQPRTEKEPGVLDQLDNRTLTLNWKRWSRARQCDHRQRLSFVEMQRLFMATTAIDGEIFVRLRFGDGDYGASLEFIDPACCPVEYNDRASNGNRIIFGIEYNSSDRVVAYYFDRGDQYTSKRSLYRVPAEEVIHAFIPEMVGQRRGIPWMSTSLFRMKMLSSYEDAAITNARAGASKMGFFTSDVGEQYQGDGVDAQGNIICEFESGIMEQLPAGVRFEAFDPKYPEGQFSEFMKTTLRGIAAGLGVSYHALANDLEGVNFSSIRAGLMEEREFWQGLQNWMIESFMIPVYEHWLRNGLIAGAIKDTAGNALPVSRKAKFENVRFQPKKWPWVDPLRDVQANIEAINNGMKSRQQCIMEIGGNPQEIWAQLAEEQKNEVLNSGKYGE